jgi:translation initiation factor 3 subunit J
MSGDWDGTSESDSEPPVKGKPTNPAQTKATPAKTTSPPAKKPAVVRSKWDGEDKEEEGTPVSDWEESSEEESEEEEKVAPVAPPKKKGTLKAKLAEKEAQKALKHSDSDDSEDSDSDAVLDPREKARRDKERELKADLNNAADLLGGAALGGTSSEIDSLISFQPRTKDDFEKLSDRIIEFIIKRHQSKPLFPTFIEYHARALAMPLKDVEVRKVASGLTTLANEKQKEQRDKASGKKKPKAASKPGLAGAKTSSKLDTRVYDEALDDFGTAADDFM